MCRHVPLPFSALGPRALVSLSPFPKFLGHLHLICPSAPLYLNNHAGIVCRDRHSTLLPQSQFFPTPRRFRDHSFATPFLSSAWRLLKSLASLFQTPVLCFQPFAASSRKTPGVAPRRPFTSRRSRTPSHENFAPPFFSWPYELLFPQAHSFHNHLDPPGVTLQALCLSSRTRR